MLSCQEHTKPDRSEEPSARPAGFVSDDAKKRRERDALPPVEVCIHAAPTTTWAGGTITRDHQFITPPPAGNHTCYASWVRRARPPLADNEGGRLLAIAHPPGGARRVFKLKPGDVPIRCSTNRHQEMAKSLPVCHCFLLLSYYLTPDDDDDTSIGLLLYTWSVWRAA
ncbi:hypothetical protein SORBI_3001G185450 [Sorghum bicolor]|uniref:Uncharacterized protein n=1 Tax=Sorghum bicolor TaxID=4558 RepID=A0A1Z5S698_SORBI|nr:hypothetical protein SORBI_3001G185450 [Sorghum bicolor]